MSKNRVQGRAALGNGGLGGAGSVAEDGAFVNVRLNGLSLPRLGSEGDLGLGSHVQPAPPSPQRTRLERSLQLRAAKWEKAQLFPTGTGLAFVEQQIEDGKVFEAGENINSVVITALVGPISRTVKPLSAAAEPDPSRRCRMRALRWSSVGLQSDQHVRRITMGAMQEWVRGSLTPRPRP
jgi:hypothetical protein